MPTTFQDFSESGSITNSNYLIGYSSASTGGEKRWRFDTIADSLTSTFAASLTSNNANWDSVYSTVQSASANYILDGGNTKGSNLLIGTNDNFNLALETNGLPRVTILNDGNVGIDESSPEARLHVTAGSAGSVTAQPSSVGVFESSGHAYLSLLSPTSRFAGVVMGGPTNPYGSYMSWNHDNLTLKVATNHTGASIQMLAGTEQEALRITSAGNVGIGTTAPNEKLTVSGNVSLSGLNLVYSTERLANPTISSSTLTLNLTSASFFLVNLNSNITTFTLTNVPPSPNVYSFTLLLSADGTLRSVTWPTGTRWSGGTIPTLTSTLNKVDTFTFVTYNGGSDWFAYTSNQNQ